MIETYRLILRDWRDADFAPFLAMNRDPEVRRYLGPAQSADEVRAGVEVACEALHAVCAVVLWREEGRVSWLCVSSLWS